MDLGKSMGRKTHTENAVFFHLEGRIQGDFFKK